MSFRTSAIFLGPYTPIKIKHEPGHYLKRMYLDTVTYHPPAAQLAVDTVGADHVLYGSDAPPLTSLKPRAIKVVESLKVTSEEREKIFWRNAAKLLKLDLPKTS
jgi:aminocarboxymuconate-semialdehyde decarboxylase